MGQHAHEALPVIDDHGFSREDQTSREQNHSGTGRAHRRSRRNVVVDASVLLADETVLDGSHGHAEILEASERKSHGRIDRRLKRAKLVSARIARANGVQQKPGVTQRRLRRRRRR